MARIKRLGIFSFARFQGYLGGLIGLVLGILYSFGGLLIDTLVSLGWMTTTETPGLSMGTLLAFGALVGMPLIGAIAGFAAGIVEAILYNLAAPVIGGLSLYFRQD